MTIPDLEADTGEHQKPGRKHPPKSLAGAILAGLLAGGGGSAILPIVIPALYRPDPARGSELRHLESEVARLERRVEALAAKTELFLVRGPSEVRADLAEIKSKLDELARDLARREHKH